MDCREIVEEFQHPNKAPGSNWQGDHMPELVALYTTLVEVPHRKFDCANDVQAVLECYGTLDELEERLTRGDALATIMENIVSFSGVGQKSIFEALFALQSSAFYDDSFGGAFRIGRTTMGEMFLMRLREYLFPTSTW